MPRLQGISQKQAVRVFQKLGYRVVREIRPPDHEQWHHASRDSAP